MFCDLMFTNFWGYTCDIFYVTLVNFAAQEHVLHRNSDTHFSLDAGKIRCFVLALKHVVDVVFRTV